MNISQEQYSNIQIMLNTLINLDKSQGKEIEFCNIKGYIDRVASMLGLALDEEVYKRLETDIEYQYQIKHTEAGIIRDNYEDNIEWYSNDDIEEPFFWERYRRYLINQGSLDITSINLLDHTTLPNIMNCLGNPKAQLSEKKLRRGLVIGDVQSGKTATYAGLICKAADAGYKVVILLAGITENLRRQTQERIDEAVIGRSSLPTAAPGSRVGVGLDNKPNRATSFTSVVSDFVGDCDKISTTIAQHNSLIVFVIKKNVSVLEKLRYWLQDQNLDPIQGCIDHPMLLIDDEADNASVNTKKDQTDPTKTNKLIRQICNLFKNSTYIGFTATPFANVFIDPDSVDEMKRADLFPEHFIYALPTPSSYIGAERIFNPLGDHHDCIQYIPDIEEPDYTSDEFRDNEKYNLELLDKGPFYYKHKKTWHGILPASLRESMLCFFLANVIRDIRGDNAKPRSMLINMSRFVKVQQYIREQVEDIYRDVFHKILYDFNDDRKKNTSLALYKELKNVWNSYYADVEDVTFERVIDKQHLINAIEHIEILVVNGSKGSNKLDYKTTKRVIAVGGLALSRGLTLEGLLVSYFYRNTSTFDVLMQMGRWFGYRPKYDDIFRIWTSYESAYWYQEISQATEALKGDIKQMYEQQLTPKDFGLKVRDYCDELQITAANKMRASYDLTMQTSYYGNIYDTPYVSLNVSQNTKNKQETCQLVELLRSKGYHYLYAQDIEGESKRNFEGKSRVFVDVPKNIIINYLESITCSMANMNFNIQNILNFLQDKDSEGIDTWDVVFEGGVSEEHYDIPGLEDINCVDRAIYTPVARRVVQVSSRRRLLGLREGKFALTKAEIEQAEQKQREVWCRDEGISERAAKDRNVPLKAYFQYLPHRKPILIIMLIHPKPAEPFAKEEKYLVKFREELGDDKIIAFAVGFPGTKDPEKAKKYKVNKIYYQLNMIDEAEGEEDEE